MKKIGLFAIAALLTSGIVLGTTSCGKDDEEPKDPDTSLPDGGDSNTDGGETENEKIDLPALPTDKFATQVTAEGIKFNAVIELNTEAHSFVLQIRGEDKTEINKPGTYIYEEGFGYTFTFAGDNSGIATIYNADTKSHEYNIRLALGEAGDVDATLTLKDESFVAVKLTDELRFVRSTKFLSNQFALAEEEAPKAAAEPGQPGKPGEGQPGGGGRPQQKPKGVLKISFLETDVNILGYTADERTQLHEYDKKGTYTFDNNTFTLTIGEKEYKSTFNLITREYTIPYEEGIVFKYNPTIGEDTLHGYSDFKGGVDLDLYMFPDGTMFGDATTGMKSMNAAFDTRGTWVEEEDGSRTLNYNSFGQDKTVKVLPVEGKPGEYTCTYLLTGSEAKDLTFELTGKLNKVFELKGDIVHDPEGHPITINMGVQFTGENTAKFVMVGPEGVKTEDCAYTFVDNIITVTQNGKTPCTSTYDEATGTYTLPLTYYSTIPTVGEFDFVGNLTYCIF